MARVLPLVCLLAVALVALLSGCDATYPVVVAPHEHELYKSKCSSEYDVHTGYPYKYPAWGYYGYPGWGYHGYPSYAYHGYPSYGYHGYPSYGYGHKYGHKYGHW